MEQKLEVQKIHYQRNIKSELTGSHQAKLIKQMSLTYLWMALGLFITVVTSCIVYKVDSLRHFIIDTGPVFYIIVTAQLIAVCTFTIISKACSQLTAALLYLLYSTLVGITISIIFVEYKLLSIIQVFASTMIAFIGLSVYGLVTKRSLNFIGSFCMTGLIGLVILGLLFFLVPELYTQTAQLSWSAAGVIVFSGLIAYDNQKLKEMLISAEYLNPRSGTINAALFLYLDFINLFLDILNLFGKKK
jgi:FtsH-binding integral membrane protein